MNVHSVDRPADAFARHTEWGRRASMLYQRAYAQQYRAHDDALGGVAAFVFLSEWIGRVAASCPPGFAALDLGCGTGRYFWAIRGAGSIVGIDASAAMLDEARRPLAADRITARSIRLIEGDLITYPFDAASFDLVYAIGVLAEHSPIDERVVSNVARWLRPGGRFAFTTVHPESPSIPRTAGRTLGRWIVPLTGGALRRSVRRALLSGGLYADETRIRELLKPPFAIESLSPFESEAHLHCVCVARKTDLAR